jgi:hypothetical protein
MHRRALVKPQRRNMCTFSLKPRTRYDNVIIDYVPLCAPAAGENRTRFSRLCSLFDCCRGVAFSWMRLFYAVRQSLRQTARTLTSTIETL